MALMSVITTSDGTLGFEDDDNPGSRAVVFIPGGLHSRRFRHPDPVEGVRLISVDRPGYGLTEPMAPESWARGVVDLLDELGIAVAGLVAWSAGARFALRCAAEDRERRFGRVALAAPEPEVHDHGSHPMGAWFRFAAEDPDGAGAMFETLVEAGLRDIDATVDRHVDEYALTAVAADSVLRRVWTESLREATVQGAAGLLADARDSSRPWGFDLAAVRNPIRVYAGDLDPVATPEAMAELSDRLGAELHIVRAGHDLPLAVWAPMLTWAAEAPVSLAL